MRCVMESNGNAVREWEVDDEAIGEGGMELKLAYAGGEVGKMQKEVLIGKVPVKFGRVLCSRKKSVRKYWENAKYWP